MLEFRDPQADGTIDVEGNVRRLPPGASCKGMFLNDVLDRARRASPGTDVFALARVPPRRYTVFLEYPYSDFIRLVVAAAGVVYPRMPTAAAVRTFARHAYDTFFESHAGRVMFGVLGFDVEAVLVLGAKGYKLAVNFGELEVERVGPRHLRYHYRNMPALLESYQVGVVEGALAHYRVEGRVRVALRDLANGTFDITWSPPA